MKLAVIGSRSFNDYNLLKRKLDNLKEIKLVISGGAKGADTLAEKWARENEVSTCLFLPDHKKNNRGAYRIRNEEIVLACDEIIAFWDGKSKGTKYTIEFAKKNDKRVTIYSYPE